MSFVLTTNYALKKPDVNTEIDAWGDDINANFDITDARMKTNADAAANALTVANGKAAASHSHAAGDITSGTLAIARMPASTGDVIQAAGSDVTVIGASRVVNSMLANMGASTIKGSLAGGAPIDLNAAQAASIIGSSLAIADDSVTNLKLANMPAGTLKGNSSGGTTDPADLPSATVMTMLGAASATALTDGITKEVQNAQTGTTYVLVASDAGKMVTLSNASAIALSVNSSVFVAGHRVDIMQLGAGQVTVGGSATQRSRSGTKLAGQYAAATIWFISATEYVLFGDTTT